MDDKMKLEIAKLEADGYEVKVTVNHNTDKWDKYIKEYQAFNIMYAWCGGSGGAPKHPSEFFTTEFEVVRNNWIPTWQLGQKS